MRRLVSNLFQDINLRSLRERILLLFTGAAILCALFYYGLIENLLQSKEILLQNSYHLQHTLKASVSQLKLMEKKQVKNQNKSANRTPQTLIVNAKAMPQFLFLIFSNLENLTLIKFETLPAQHFQVNSQRALRYKQEIKLSLKGNYEQLWDYVKRLESMPYYIAWKSVDYKITDYPDASIILILNIISDNPNWIDL